MYLDIDDQCINNSRPSVRRTFEVVDFIIGYNLVAVYKILEYQSAVTSSAFCR